MRAQFIEASADFLDLLLREKAHLTCWSGAFDVISLIDHLFSEPGSVDHVRADQPLVPAKVSSSLRLP